MNETVSAIFFSVLVVVVVYRKAIGLGKLILPDCCICLSFPGFPGRIVGISCIAPQHLQIGIVRPFFPFGTLFISFLSHCSSCCFEHSIGKEWAVGSPVLFLSSGDCFKHFSSEDGISCGFSHLSSIILRCVLSSPTFSRTLIVKTCGMLSKNFSASIERAI